jgi:hydroxymethylglutaryl-CoA synthase
MYLSKTLGNIYTGSLYTGLLSLMLQSSIAGKRVLMFSYGGGLMSSMFTIKIRDDLQDMRRVIDFESRLSRRIAITPQEYDRIMQEKENRYGKVLGRIKILPEMLEDGTFYLTEVDDKMRRKYQQTKLP